MGEYACSSCGVADVFVWQVDPATADWIFPHVIGGIPTHIVDHEYPMIREGKRFTVRESDGCECYTRVQCMKCIVAAVQLCACLTSSFQTNDSLHGITGH